MWCKNLIATFLLALFAMVQLGGLHELTHDDDTPTCEVCKVVQEAQNQDILAPTVAVIELPIPSSFTYVGIFEEYAFAKAEQYTVTHTTRPPPYTI